MNGFSLHRLQHGARRVHPRAFTLVELMVVVAIMALLAAAAIPTLIRYTRRARSMEAVQSIRRIFDGAVSYFSTDYATPAGIITPNQFPASSPPTPPLTSVGSTKVRTPESAWSTPTWSGLHFSMADPHYYAYQFDSSGVFGSASFTVSSFGDLDGDDVLATFVRFSTVDNMGVQGSQGVFVSREIE